MPVPHLLQSVANDEKPFAGQDLLLHSHRVLQELHHKREQSAANKQTDGKWRKMESEETVTIIYELLTKPWL